ncbi:unnamed protein product [Bursaphelenchus okinawaensis]|uniref:Uncharacterized protein n=1 Tax=Bursaphelenchus okinawaensis TaxID=465554 RepID=A0A811KBP0_9BILA|nr:unnamed protein product [Bursaphelenchus okinawaensis]CAG9101093.1 unnamed protein product [Bursaphelenchus okinawaensis]
MTTEDQLLANVFNNVNLPEVKYTETVTTTTTEVPVPKRRTGPEPARPKHSRQSSQASNVSLGSRRSSEQKRIAEVQKQVELKRVEVYTDSEGVVHRDETIIQTRSRSSSDSSTSTIKAEPVQPTGGMGLAKVGESVLPTNGADAQNGATPTGGMFLAKLGQELQASDENPAYATVIKEIKQVTKTVSNSVTSPASNEHKVPLDPTPIDLEQVFAGIPPRERAASARSRQSSRPRIGTPMSKAEQHQVEQELDELDKNYRRISHNTSIEGEYELRHGSVRSSRASSATGRAHLTSQTEPQDHIYDDVPESENQQPPRPPKHRRESSNSSSYVVVPYDTNDTQDRILKEIGWKVEDSEDNRGYGGHGHNDDNSHGYSNQDGRGYGNHDGRTHSYSNHDIRGYNTNDVYDTVRSNKSTASRASVKILAEPASKSRSGSVKPVATYASPLSGSVQRKLKTGPPELPNHEAHGVVLGGVGQRIQSSNSIGQGVGTGIGQGGRVGNGTSIGQRVRGDSIGQSIGLNRNDIGRGSRISEHVQMPPKQPIRQTRSYNDPVAFTGFNSRPSAPSHGSVHYSEIGDVQSLRRAFEQESEDSRSYGAQNNLFNGTYGGSGTQAHGEHPTATIRSVSQGYGNGYGSNGYGSQGTDNRSQNLAQTVSSGQKVYRSPSSKASNILSSQQNVAPTHAIRNVATSQSYDANDNKNVFLEKHQDYVTYHLCGRHNIKKAKKHLRHVQIYEPIPEIVPQLEQQLLEHEAKEKLRQQEAELERQRLEQEAVERELLQQQLREQQKLELQRIEQLQLEKQRLQQQKHQQRLEELRFEQHKLEQQRLEQEERHRLFLQQQAQEEQLWQQKQEELLEQRQQQKQQELRLQQEKQSWQQKRRQQEQQLEQLETQQLQKQLQLQQQKQFSSQSQHQTQSYLEQRDQQDRQSLLSVHLEDGTVPASYYKKAHVRVEQPVYHKDRNMVNYDELTALEKALLKRRLLEDGHNEEKIITVNSYGNAYGTANGTNESTLSRPSSEAHHAHANSGVTHQHQNGITREHEQREIHGRHEHHGQEHVYDEVPDSKKRVESGSESHRSALESGDLSDATLQSHKEYKEQVSRSENGQRIVTEHHHVVDVCPLCTVEDRRREQDNVSILSFPTTIYDQIE